MRVLDSLSLRGKTALITGAGTGIGLGIARGLAEAGADIAAVYNSHHPAELENEVKQLGGRFLALRLDLADKKTWPLAVEKTVQEFGRLDILVNNSGICLRAPALEHSEEQWDAVVQLDQKALFFLAQAAARQFVKQGTRGKIINIASMLSFLGGFNCCSYAAAKHAVLGLTRVLASEWAAKNINVNAIAPGWIRTNLSAPLQADPERNRAIVARIPAGDWGEIDDFKGVAVLLASSASDYINGACIPVDGGYLVK